MVIKNQREICCLFCRKVHTLHEYVGLEDAWYSSHYCEEERAAFIAQLDKEEEE